MQLVYLAHVMHLAFVLHGGPLESDDISAERQLTG